MFDLPFTAADTKDWPFALFERNVNMVSCRFFLAALLLSSMAFAAVSPWETAEERATEANRAVVYCLNYANGWLAHADPASGLLPRRLNEDNFWNAKDCAADNFPFLLLTAQMTGQHHLKNAALRLLEQERALCMRVDSLPDTYHFDRQGFTDGPPKMDEVVFGAAEYAKDGLMPAVEWLGPGPWLDRMVEMVDDIWKHTLVDTPHGPLPSPVLEVNGDLLQVMSRLFWITGDTKYRDWCFRIADHYLLHETLLETEKIPLRDHGCEIVGGLSETYVIAANTAPGKRDAYRAPLRALLDAILEKGTFEDGMMPNSFNPLTGEKDAKSISDGWGYVYNAFLTVAEVDGHAPYKAALEKALRNVHRHLGANWEGYRGDGYADSVEGAVNLLNRIPVKSAFEWAAQSLEFIYAIQRPDGTAEGWYGDGNSARTMMMLALHRTQGVTAQPWRADVRLGAVLDDKGTLHLILSSDWAWNGLLKFDVPRHREWFNLPFDYPRINQFPEWFTVDKNAEYMVSLNGGAETRMTGPELVQLPATVEAGGQLRLTVRNPNRQTPQEHADDTPWRGAGFPASTREAAEAWRENTRKQCMDLLGLTESLSALADRSVKSEVLEETVQEGYRLRKVALQQLFSNRTITVLVGLPDLECNRDLPAVLCVPGHGSVPADVFDGQSIYKGFAGVFAKSGFVVLAADTAYHDKDPGFKTLMGQRVYDLVRCVDYLSALPEVDPLRMGCAGLSLGGEMTMWLAALDTRLAATCSAGFLTFMNQMETNHCMCWKEEGLRELVDFPDIYALIAPRRLQCQIGEKEPVNQFTPVLARRAFREIQKCYTLLGASEHAELAVHPGAHEIALERLVAFMAGALTANDGNTVE